MLTKTKIALAAALVIGSASVALADGEFDPNLGNRYPAYNEPYARSAPVERTAPVRLQTPESFVTHRRHIRHR